MKTIDDHSIQFRAGLFARFGRLVLASTMAALIHVSSVGAADAPATSESEMFAAVDRIFADYAIDSHIPGLVYGIVANGRLVYVRGIGVQDLESNRPVTPETLFRIAFEGLYGPYGFEAARRREAPA